MKNTTPLLLVLALSAAPATLYASDDQLIGPPNVGQAADVPSDWQGRQPAGSPASGGQAPGGYEAEIPQNGPAVVAVPGMPTFADIDSDRSGFIEQSELPPGSGLDFTSADSDGDGRLSPSEYEGTMRGQGGAPELMAPR